MTPVTSDRLLKVWETLHRACGLEPVAPTYNDQARLSEFMAEMVGLDQTEAGPLRPRDILAVVAFMRNEVRMGRGRWAIRPNAILQRPEQFRDLVLQTRKPLRARGEPVARDVVRADGTHIRSTDPVDPEPRLAGPVAAAALAAIRVNIAGGSNSVRRPPLQ